MLDVIAFAAHPDDAEAACGGMLVVLAQRGYRTAICDLTRGELSSNGDPELRAREATAAARVLGLATRLQLGLPDGGIDEGDGAQVDAVLRVLREHAPRLIVGPYERARHPDHVQAAALVRRAQFFSAVRRRLPEVPHVARPVLVRGVDYWPMQASFIFDIGTALAIKLEALRCYRSQFERDPGGVATVLNAPDYLARIETDARHYGRLIGRAAGEPYRVDGGVPLEDPVQALSVPGEVRP